MFILDFKSWICQEDSVLHFSSSTCSMTTNLLGHRLSLSQGPTQHLSARTMFFSNEKLETK